jgi:hypothetical protein
MMHGLAPQSSACVDCSLATRGVERVKEKAASGIETPMTLL